MKAKSTQVVLTINGRRDAYSIQQIMDYCHTMTVGELREHLEQYPDDMPVMLNNDNGYTYGSISSLSFEEEEYEPEEDEESEEEGES